MGPKSIVAVFQLAQRPGPGVGPPCLGRAARDPQRRGGLREAQSGEIIRGRKKTVSWFGRKWRIVLRRRFVQGFAGAEAL
jgi:hypothetical protein